MVRKFPPFHSERKKRSTSKGTPQFPNGISGKLPYFLTSNRNFRSFWPNGKHPRSADVESFCESIGNQISEKAKVHGKMILLGYASITYKYEASTCMIDVHLFVK